MARTVTHAKTGGKKSTWTKVAADASISSSELTALALHLLAAPGPILARCAKRHGIDIDDRKSIEKLFWFGWDQLRTYLGHRTFVQLISRTSRKRRYPEALCGAMLKGCFEAVLDEQMSILVRSGGHSGLGIIDELTSGVLHRPGRVRLRTRRRLDGKILVQAAIPFSGGEQTKAVGARLRSDAIRKAFNSPFWPHVLTTTSIGQEGLDFHQWCGRVVHWDLPSDPVDFEQREGRIARYGSVRVRQALAREYGAEALRTAGGDSPFAKLIKLSGERRTGRTGLETWWIAEKVKPESVTFTWRFSIRSARKAGMLRDLLYYRLGLGQPEPSAFLAMLKRINADAQTARSLAINLAPIDAPRLQMAAE